MDNSLGAYEIRECIGRGSYGDVFLGVNKETGAHVALKVIDLEDVEDDIEDIHKEITMLAGCRCKNITEYHGSLLKPRSTELMIVMELMACSVADLVRARTHMFQLHAPAGQTQPLVRSIRPRQQQQQQQQQKLFPCSQ